MNSATEEMSVCQQTCLSSSSADLSWVTRARSMTGISHSVVLFLLSAYVRFVSVMHA